jgi:hypothetical protein
MIKDIHYPEVTDIAVAVVKEETPEGEVWTVYLAKFERGKHIQTWCTGFLKRVRSKKWGRGKTSTLRHFIDDMPCKSLCQN